MSGLRPFLPEPRRPSQPVTITAAPNAMAVPGPERARTHASGVQITSPGAMVAADGDPGHPWHTGRNQEEFVLYKASYVSGEEVLLPKNLDATYSEWEPGIDPIYPDADAFKVRVETPAGVTYDDIESPAFIADLEELTGRSLRVQSGRV